MINSLKQAIPYDRKCQLLRSWRSFGNRFRTARYQQFLFILCAPYSGSTLLHEILSAANTVSANNIFGTREGQSLPEYRQLMDYQVRWSESTTLPWPKIREIWLSYWDISKAILLDKSPPNLMRTAAIEQHFQPAYFIAMVRNPYAHCESLHRRDKMSIREAAQFSIKCLKFQKHNIENCQHICYFKYEDLVDQPEKVKQQILNFLPQLQHLDTDKRFKAHNFKNKRLPLRNLNEEKIARLSKEQLTIINKEWRPHQYLLNYFDYSLR